MVAAPEVILPVKLPEATEPRIILRSLVETSTEETVVVVPLTVRLPPTLKLPPTALKESTYVLTAF